TAKARIGDRISASRILMNPLNLTAPKPADTMTAPVIAPMMACDELLGIPKYQVSKFQMIAANNAARMTVVPSSNTNGSAIPLVIVCATPVNVRAPMKFIVAASKMALLGVNAFVETDVAIAFAVSWNPLIKSNDLQHVQESFIMRMFVVFVIGGIVAILLSTLFTRKLVTPLSNLKKELKKVERRQFGELTPIHATGEIKEVEKRVYEMADELNQ